MLSVHKSSVFHFRNPGSVSCPVRPSSGKNLTAESTLYFMHFFLFFQSTSQDGHSPPLSSPLPLPPPPLRKLFLKLLARYSLVVDQQGGGEGVKEGGREGVGATAAMWHTPFLPRRPHHRSDVHHNEQFVRRGCQLGHFSAAFLWWDSYCYLLDMECPLACVCVLCLC